LAHNVCLNSAGVCESVWVCLRMCVGLKFLVAKAFWPVSLADETGTPSQRRWRASVANICRGTSMRN